MSKPLSYAPPLDSLLSLGRPGGQDEGPWTNVPLADYVQRGIAPEHAHDLLRMAHDPLFDVADEPACYAPIHACRALGVLGAVEAIPRLVSLMHRMVRHDDDYGLEDMPVVFACMGPRAIDPLVRALRDQREPFGVRLYLCDALERIALKHSGARDPVVAQFTSMLGYARYTDPGLNGHIIGSLIELSAAESLPAIAATYHAGFVDEQCCGSLAQVEGEIVLSAEERRATRAARLAPILARYEAEERAMGALAYEGSRRT